MNATELFLADGRSAGIYFCEKCRIVQRNQEDAEKCCQPWRCQQCGKECGRYQTLCIRCHEDYRLMQWLQRLAAAEEVSAAEYHGLVYYEGRSNDGFFEDVDHLIDDFADNGEEPPEFALCCKARHFKLDARQIIEDAECACEIDGCEGYEPDYNGLDEFIAACERFTRENQRVKTYWPDYKRKVRVR